MFYLKYIQFLNCKRMSYIPCKSFKYCKLGQNKYWGGGGGDRKNKKTFQTETINPNSYN